MSNPDRQEQPPINRTLQNMHGWSFDESFKVLAFENLAFNPSSNTLERVTKSMVAGKDFDYLSVANSDTNEDTLTYKTGGSSGTTVQTIVITYAAGAEKISDSFAGLEWS